jgi:hypothetical protein
MFEQKFHQTFQKAWLIIQLGFLVCLTFQTGRRKSVFTDMYDGKMFKTIDLNKKTSYKSPNFPKIRLLC